MNEIKCDICQRLFPEDELILGHGIRHEIETLITADHPEWSDNSHICKDDFDRYRIEYVQKMLEEDEGNLQKLEADVLESIRESELITANINSKFDEQRTVGQKVADKVASFGGSWKFIGLFFTILILWVIANTIALFQQPFDPYPFILLNLILSCIAAIQAPIIMMSQNRMGDKDRIRSENDYKVNLKAEIEIKTLTEKVDHLLLDQWSKMMKIQQIQMEMLEDIRKGLVKSGNGDNKAQ
jgi:uncharacterized membrane protein